MKYVGEDKESEQNKQIYFFILSMTGLKAKNARLQIKFNHILQHKIYKYPK